MRVALVHDWLNQMGGAEAVLEALVEAFPGAPIYTSIYARDRMPAHYRGWEIHTTWLDAMPFIHRHHQLYLPLYPLAFDGLNLSGYDVVISNKSGFCHGVVTGPSTVHLCYCLTPTRYVWAYEEYIAREGLPGPLRRLLRPLIAVLRVWDRMAADRVDAFIAISREVARRIRKFYRRPSILLHPPVDVQRFQPTTRTEDYFLIVSRLIPYKRIDLAIEAFNRLGLPLVIVGDGRDRWRLQRMAGPTITFLGRVPAEQLTELYARCRAFVFPGVEDFGIAPVEAMAAGRPVIAFAAGGALDTVVEGVTGVFFHASTPESLAEAVRRLEGLRFDPGVIRRHAEQFDKGVFQEKIKKIVELAWEVARQGQDVEQALLDRWGASLS
ncbi:glycosyltransferase [Thermoflexus sp.]|uniref:glycosyltransferase n=1 Tax=Thermoflexus sp. TaxID=1969742 RepID=UPI0035E4042E